MNKMDLIEHVAGEMDMSRSAANRAVDTIIAGITKALKKGEEVRITGRPETPAARQAITAVLCIGPVFSGGRCCISHGARHRWRSTPRSAWNLRRQRRSLSTAS